MAGSTTETDPYQRAAKAAQLNKQIAGHESTVNELNARIARLEQAREGVENLEAQNEIRLRFSADLMARMFEIPVALEVPVYNDDWTGHAATAFATGYRTITNDITKYCSTSYTATKMFRMQVEISQTGLKAAVILINSRIAELRNEITRTQAEISSLKGQLCGTSN